MKYKFLNRREHGILIFKRCVTEYDLFCCRYTCYDGKRTYGNRKDKGFVNAEQLWIGAELVDNNGNTLCIEQICREELDNETVKV